MLVARQYLKEAGKFLMRRAGTARACLGQRRHGRGSVRVIMQDDTRRDHT